jgi:ABC-type bacteriocin/lantibiotic exporter with double-glycine peptidase domain
MHASISPSLGSIFRCFRGRILITFGFLTLENGIEVATPLLVGLAIDGLISGRQTELWILAAILILSTLIGTARRFYDTRAYADIHVQLASEAMEKGWHEGLSLSAQNTRSELLREMVDFFEQEVPETYRSLTKIIGSFVLLWFFAPLLNLLVLGSALLIIAIYAFSAPRIFRLNQGLNNQWERQVAILQRQELKRTATHFRAMARWKIRLSDLEAISYGGIALILITLVLATLVIITADGISSTGTVFAVLVYVLDISEGAWQLPSVFQKFVRLREIAQRMKPTKHRAATAIRTGFNK